MLASSGEHWKRMLVNVPSRVVFSTPSATSLQFQVKSSIVCVDFQSSTVPSSGRQHNQIYSLLEYVWKQGPHSERTHIGRFTIRGFCGWVVSFLTYANYWFLDIRAAIWSPLHMLCNWMRIISIAMATCLPHTLLALQLCSMVQEFAKFLHYQTLHPSIWRWQGTSFLKISLKAMVPYNNRQKKRIKTDKRQDYSFVLLRWPLLVRLLHCSMRWDSAS